MGRMSWGWVAQQHDYLVRLGTVYGNQEKSSHSFRAVYYSQQELNKACWALCVNVLLSGLNRIKSHYWRYDPTLLPSLHPLWVNVRTGTFLETHQKVEQLHPEQHSRKQAGHQHTWLQHGIHIENHAQELGSKQELAKACASLRHQWQTPFLTQESWQKETVLELVHKANFKKKEKKKKTLPKPYI